MKLNSLFDWYKTTREWNRLKPNSKIMYQQMMNNATLYFEHNRASEKIKLITTREVDSWYEVICRLNSVSGANLIMKVMRRIWNVAKRDGQVKSNPFEHMGLQSTEPRTVIWTKEQVKQIVDGLYSRKYYDTYMLIKLCYYLGQRPGDMSKLTCDNFNEFNHTVTFIQEKTGTLLSLPVPVELRIDLQYLALTTTSLREHNKVFRYVMNEIGLPKELQIRDLRRTALTEIMESGATDAEGQAISGHKNRDMLNTYAPSTLKMAQAAMNKRFNH